MTRLNINDDKAQSVKDTIRDLNAQLLELSQQKLDSIIDYFNAFTGKLDSMADKMEALSSYTEELRGYGDESALNGQRYYTERKLSDLQSQYDAYLTEYQRQIASGQIERGSTRDAEARQQLAEILTEIVNTKSELLDIEKAVTEIAVNHLETVSQPYETYNSYLESVVSRWEAENSYFNSRNGRDGGSYVRQAALAQNAIAQNAQREYDAYRKTIQEELKAGRLKKNTQEYTEAMAQLQKLREQTLKAREAVEEYNNKIREANWSKWEKYIEILEHIQSNLKSIGGLLDEFNMYDSKTGKLTDYGSAQINLYSAQMLEARKEVAEYQAAIKKLNKEYKDGQITKEEYDSQYADLYEKELSAASQVQASRQSIIDAVRKGIEAETKAMSDLIAKRKEALQRQKDADNYARTVRDKTKDINKIRQQMAALSGDTTQATQAKLRQLEAELAEKEQDLDDTRRDHEYDVVTQGLDDELDEFQRIQDEKTEALTSNLEYQNQVIHDALGVTIDEYKSTFEIIQKLAKEYGISIPEALMQRFRTLGAANWMAAQSQRPQNANGQFGNTPPLGNGVLPENGMMPETNEEKIARLTKESAAAKAAMGAAWRNKKAAKGAYNKARAFIVKQDNTPFREDPGKGKILARLKAGTRVMHTGNISGNFYEVTYKKQTGWVHIKFLRNEYGMNASARKSAISAYKSAATKYNAAKNDYNAINDQLVTLRDGASNWLDQYEQNAQQNANNAAQQQQQQQQQHQQQQPQKPEEDSDKSKIYVIYKGASNIRSGAGGSYPIQATFGNGKELTYMSEKDGWTQVKYKGADGKTHVGWIASYLIKKKYAHGTKFAKAGLALTDERGLGSEAILTKDGVLRQLNAGDMVFNKAQKEALWQMSKLDISSMLKGIGAATPTLTVQNNYGSLLTVNGDVSKDTLPELKTILDMAVEKTKKEIINGMVKNGFAKR